LDTEQLNTLTPFFLAVLQQIAHGDKVTIAVLEVGSKKKNSSQRRTDRLFAQT